MSVPTKPPARGHAGPPRWDDDAVTAPIALPRLVVPRRRGRRFAIAAAVIVVVAAVAAAGAVVVTRTGTTTTPGPAPAPASAPPPSAAAPLPPLGAAPAPDALRDAALGSAVLSGTRIQELAGCAPSNENNQADVPNEAVLPGGLLYVNCFTDVTVIDLHSGRVTMKLPSGADAAYPGAAHVFTARQTQIPAGPLTPSRQAESLQAFDPRTGAQVWDTPIETWASEDGRRPTQVTEDAAGVYVSANGTTMLDAASGRELWHLDTAYVTEASGAYAGRGTVEADGYEDNLYGSHWTGFDVRTGARRWDVTIPEDLAGTSHDDFVADDGSAWKVSNRYFVGYDLRTGAVRARGPLPAVVAASQDNRTVAADPGAAVLADETSLTQVPLGASGRARWTVPGRAEPKLVTRDVVGAEGPIGVVLLRSSDGGLLASLPGAHMPAQQQVEGLALLSDASVVKVVAGG